MKFYERIKHVVLVAFRGYISGVILYQTSVCWRRQYRRQSKLINQSQRRDMSTTRLLLVTLLLAFLTTYCLASPHSSGSKMKKRE